MYILEFKNRSGQPLYHLEHFIEGEYIKYNSNSGFVDENLRYTPQVSRNKYIINHIRNTRFFSEVLSFTVKICSISQEFLQIYQAIL